MSQQIYEQVGVAMTCRGYEEYLSMFGLTEAELSTGPILDVAAGGSSFTAEARSRGYQAFAVDPRYGGDVQKWIAEAREEIATSTAKLDALKDRFDWSYYGSIDRHREGREASLTKFASHVQSEDGVFCYKGGSLPKLPYQDHEFSLVLCSHFLFLYAEQFGYSFHENAVRELMRVCRPGGKVRIYPLISLHWKPYEKLEGLMEMIRREGGAPALKNSSLPFIPDSNQFLEIVIEG
ncbi:methyltransferase domain-containing protein [Paenibacillus nanensis]|uniref:Methyltransferase domain-containing protein n=1 Tax=Paenibacillus nanensis TaxID=393251 RepID=A0A3A1V2T2_9BACL|nr:methyltransferase domain-containing protein [Paenibacillus nanensis]RIX54056.1 methyltransferase domain-containing protein [Paenibacillus nanensis]